jgi:hypothetical protein
VLVTLARSKASSSASARLVPWTTLPSMQRRGPSGVDDQPAIMRDSEFARRDLAGIAVDLDLGDDRDHGTRALGIGDAAPDSYWARQLKRQRIATIMLAPPPKNHPKS